mgnify:CR=1 FL=1
MLSGKAAIAGIGATDFSKDSGRSELRLAAEAVLDALDDAGLAPSDVDGLVTFTMDSNTEQAVARAAGIGELKFFSQIHYGGGAACATVQQAAIAVATGVADVVVAYRAFNERSGMRFGQVQTALAGSVGATANSTQADNAFSYPFGLSTPAAQVAMIARRKRSVAPPTVSTEVSSARALRWPTAGAVIRTRWGSKATPGSSACAPACRIRPSSTTAR